MPDQETPVAELREMVREFVSERDWRQFHTPKNISMALSIEAAELMEHFQWLTPDQSRAIANNDKDLAAVAEELADVICYAFALANELEIDVATAMQKKMEKNRVKYPAERYRGKYK